MNNSEIKQSLRKLEFPLCAKEALTKIGQLICGNAPNITQKDLALDLSAEFVFYEVDKRGKKRNPSMKALTELNLVQILLDYLLEIPSDYSRNMVFLTLFSPTTVTQRMGVLSKLVSIAMGTNSSKVLISASTWMQQLGNTLVHNLKLVELLVNDYFIMVPDQNEALMLLPTESPQFTANFLSAVGELYFTENCNEIIFPPIGLVKMIVAWINENYKLCMAALLTESFLPLGMKAVEIITPIAGLLKWCVLAPIYKKDNELYCELHLGLLNSILEIPMCDPPIAVHVKHLSAPAICVCRYSVTLQEKANMDLIYDKNSLIREDKDLQLALNRYAQAIQVALTVKCVCGHVDEFINQILQLPENRLMTIVTNKYKNNREQTE